MPIDSQLRQPLLPPGSDLSVPDLQRDQPFSFKFLFSRVFSHFCSCSRISASFYPVYAASLLMQRRAKYVVILGLF
jgi:hypothetical protein